MKLTITCKDSIGKSLISTLAGVIEAIKLANPEADIDSLVKYDIEFGVDVRKPSEKKGTSGAKGSRVQYRAILPTLLTDAQRVIEENLRAFPAGTQQAVVYRELVKATQEGRFVTKPEVMQKCGITVESSAERILGRFSKSGIAEAVEIPISAGEGQ
jgi:hypothetical protein